MTVEHRSPFPLFPDDKGWVVSCDWCKKEFAFRKKVCYFESRADATIQARFQGWKVELWPEGQRVTCPSCFRQRRKKRRQYG